MKKKINLLYAFLIPIIILLIIFAILGYFPFGNKNILMLDGLAQYPGFLGSFIDVLTNNQSISYSFKGLLGFNNYATSVYYLFNPTNLLVLLFGKAHLLAFYNFIVLFKIGLCSLTMGIFLNYLNKNKKSNLIFSICYGLMTYNIMYYLNFMWFDSIIMLPLVIMGIEKIFKENNYLFYTIALTIAIISNFYIGYMICIFSVIYFIYKLILNKNKKKNYLIKFILYSLIAGGISAMVLIPVILGLMQGKNALFAKYYSMYFKFDLDFINVFYKLTIGSFLNGDYEYGTPNVYVSIFVLINFILFFFNKNIRKKEKFTVLGILIFFLLSMSFNLLDYFWHMMQMPIWYPVRYAFIFDFFLIFIACRNYDNYNFLSIKKSILIMILIISLITIGFFTSGNLLDSQNVSAKLIYLGISIVYIIYYFVFLNKKDLRKYLLILIIFELLLNSLLIFKNSGNTNKVSEFNNNYQNSVSILKTINDDSFYRLSFKTKTTKNNGMLYNVNEINYFSSIRNKKVINLLDNYLNLSVIDKCNVIYYYNNPIINSLFNIKYYITDDKIDYYTLKINNNKLNVYQNKDVTSLGFITSDGITNLKTTNNIANNYNNLIKSINNNNQNIMTEIKSNSSNITCTNDTCIINGSEPAINYNYTVKDDGFIFINNKVLSSDNEIKYQIILNGKIIGKTSDKAYFVHKKDKIEIIINPNMKNADITQYNVFYINNNVYQEFIKNINKNKLVIENHDQDDYLKGTINVTENNSILFTSIANDDGWKVYVDGKETSITPILNGLIGVKLSKGKHTIEFIYSVPGLKIGIIISIISLSLLIIMIRKHK